MVLNKASKNRHSSPFHINQRVALFSKLFLAFLIPLIILRLSFYLIFKSTAPQFSSSEILNALYLGTKFDIRLVFLLIIPVWFLGYLPFLNPLHFARRLWIYFYTVLFFIIVFFYGADLAHYGYLNSRVSASALQYLYNPDISFGVVWDTYPIIRSLLVLLALSFFFKLFIQKFVFKQFEYQNNSRLNQFFSYFIFFFIFAGGLYGSVSTFPLRWSEAFFSQNYFITALSLNPIIYFAETYRYKAPIYDQEKTKKYYPLMANYLGVPKEEQDINNLNFKRVVHNKPKLDFKPNIIVVVMESLAVSKTDLSGNPLNPTPYLKALADESYYFDEFYVPSQGTARSMFSILTSVPDVTSYKTASRDPTIADQNVIMDYFDGYEKFYFLGGNTNWAQIRGVYANNIKNIHIVEEGQYEKPIMDVWGLSDLDLFKETFRKLSELPPEKPFFAIIQSASFHRPYTIPEDHDDFEVKNLPLEELTKSAFISNEEWNSMRLSDYSLGAFVKLLKNSPLYENTILVVTGDHGLPDENAEHISLVRRKTEIEKYHVPLILHNPKIFPKPKVDSRLSTETDIMSTLAGLAGVSYTDMAFGRDLFDPKFNEVRASFNFFHYISPQPFALLYNGYYYTVHGDQERLYLLDPKNASMEVPKTFLDPSSELLKDGSSQTLKGSALSKIKNTTLGSSEKSLGASFENSIASSQNKNLLEKKNNPKKNEGLLSPMDIFIKNLYEASEQKDKDSKKLWDMVLLNPSEDFQKKILEKEGQNILEDVKENYPEFLTFIKDLTYGHLETSRYMLYHNKKFRNDEGKVSHEEIDSHRNEN